MSTETQTAIGLILLIGSSVFSAILWDRFGHFGHDPMGPKYHDSFHWHSVKGSKRISRRYRCLGEFDLADRWLRRHNILKFREEVREAGPQGSPYDSNNLNHPWWDDNR